MNLTVVGIGSLCRQDDAVGLKLIESLKHEKYFKCIKTELWENADLLTMTNSLLEIKEPVLIVDCVDMGKQGGSYHFFSPKNYLLKTELRSISNHGLGFAYALTLANEMGFKWPVYIFGIQPFELSLIRGLTPQMQDRFSEIFDFLLEKIALLSASGSLDSFLEQS